jgi:integrase
VDARTSPDEKALSQETERSEVMYLYKREGSKKFWFSFTHNKKRYQQSTDLECRKDAEEYASEIHTRIVKGEVGLVKKPRYKVDELLDRLEQRWQLEGKCSVQNLSLLKKVREEWGTKLADEITPDDLERYVLRRQKQQYAIATTNRVLQCLRGAYNLADIPWPKIKLLSEKGNKRKGFFTPEQMEKVLGHLPDDGLRDFICFCYATGTRRGEVAGLTWEMVEGNELRIPGDICKNRESRILPLIGSLAQIVERRKKARLVNGTLVRWLFHRGDGRQILEFRKSWKTACKKAGCGNMLCHDMRRSAARDMIRGGVLESVAMQITGHKTRAMFERYNIATTEDVRAALEKTAVYRAG